MAEIEHDSSRSDRALGRLLGCDHKTVAAVRRELSGEIPHPEPLASGDLGHLTRARDLLREAAGDREAFLRCDLPTLALIKEEAERTQLVAQEIVNRATRGLGQMLEGGGP